MVMEQERQFIVDVRCLVRCCIIVVVVSG